MSQQELPDARPPRLNSGDPPSPSNIHGRITPSKLVVLLVMLGTAVTLGYAGQDNQSNVAKLRAERLSTLETLVRVVEGRRQTGVVDILEAMNARQMLYEARLEAANSLAEKKAASAEMLKNLLEIESILSKRHDSGNVTYDEVLKAKARRLAAAITMAELE